MNTRLAPILLAVCSSTAHADVKLPAFFSDGMVLQREAAVSVWGTADPGERVLVIGSWGERAEPVFADDDGRWLAEFATPPAGGPYRLTLQGNNMLHIENVLIGEVWICSGQSNMEWTVSPGVGPGGGGVRDFEAELAAAAYPRLRMFTVERALSTEPVDDVSGTWRLATPQNTAKFSATAYFFGRELLGELDVPIGLISTSWGGTLAEAWTSKPALRSFGEFENDLDRLDEHLAGQGESELSIEERRAAWWQAVAAKDPGSELQLHSVNWEAEGIKSKPHTLPAKWETTDVGDFDGVVWLTKSFELGDSWLRDDLTVELGPIDDMDTTWFNGERIGGYETEGAWQTARRYHVGRELLRKGTNSIVIRVVDTGGAGGVYGEPDSMRLSSESGDEVLSLAGDWLLFKSLPLADMPKWPRGSWFHHNYPTALFNGMLAPLIPYTLRGAIWYQGESNRGRADQYDGLMRTLITDWRERWGIGAFPFYYVQLAPYDYGVDLGQTGRLRDAQRRTLALEATGMAVTMDIGDPSDIHPANKQDVGKRLALWALRKTYGREDLVHSGPLYRSMTHRAGRIALAFDGLGSGLEARGDKLTEFLIAGEDRVFHPANAVIEGDNVLVWSGDVPEPVAVRYGWGAASEPNLFNAEGLPAAAFRTDDWPESHD